MKVQSAVLILAGAGSALGAACKARTSTSPVQSSSSSVVVQPTVPTTSSVSVATATGAVGSGSDSNNSGSNSDSTKSSSGSGSDSGSGSASNSNANSNSSCPNVHIIAARETTAPAGFGTSLSVVQSIESAFPGATAEAIDYPAAGGNSYASSVTAGIAAVIKQVEAFNSKCPDSIIVMVGYSQGSQIMDDAFCGGPDGSSMAANAATVSAAAGDKVAALIWMGDPRAIGGLPYQVGTATLGGFAARPSNFKCPTYSSRIQSYCDSQDPYCSKGNDAQHHQEYAQIYGSQALAFVKSKVDAALGK
ncbi:hypothetical protein TD95_001007 [Thielaviopsis punctulata]|uniref:Cutinase n=1 Tax=Thielaviopsis punctulata TaxID=72032 RepID=A0A0F4ZIL8_9PEZI|nr:hypothetical protein TD95_001001 [Thielaviopsis punctulata]KKA30382.1 hypothetical protein TD95_001007 [Thielaviopsis punctulata]